MKLFPLIFVCLTACGPTGLSATQVTDPKVLNPVFHQSEANGGVCPTGGIVLAYGPDSNGNGYLEESEATGEVVTCNLVFEKKRKDKN